MDNRKKINTPMRGTYGPRSDCYITKGGEESNSANATPSLYQVITESNRTGAACY